MASLSLQVRLLAGIGDVDAASWDALVPADNPFLEHAFLLALERSGSASPEQGWVPMHLVAEENNALVAALPLYLRADSYGEYVFDWAWANGARRAGIPYYPKLTTAVPFTPSSTGRVLGDIGALPALSQAVAELASRTRASSHHVLFCTEAESTALSQHGYLPRVGLQFHWNDAGYGDFAGFLSALTSKRRKELNRERRQVSDAGIEVRCVAGQDLTVDELRFLHRCYQDTIGKNGAIPYLQPAFWMNELPILAPRVLAVLAYRGTELIAGALNLWRGRVVYGRYWGCTEDIRGLHFEVCYHQLVEWALANGLTRVEAGAQGEHKLQRGFLPSITHSAHHIREPRLRAAVERFCADERLGVEAAVEEYGKHGPFRA